MKTKLFTLLLLSVISLLLEAGDVPQAFSYQAIVRDGGGNLVAEKSILVQISIFSPANGALLPELTFYTERHVVSTDIHGFITLEVGNGHTSDNFNEINWKSNRTLFLKTEIDIENNSKVPNFDIQTSTQLLSVPFAIYASVSDTSGYAHRSAESVRADSALYLQGVKTYKIGDLYDGEDIVFWVDESGQHGYACSYRDVDPVEGRDNFKWLSKDVSIHGTRPCLGAGPFNSLLMSISNAGDIRFVPAAYDSYPGLFYPLNKNWFIPSPDELELLYSNKHVDPNLTGMYWSSHGFNTGKDAYALDFDSGHMDLYDWDNHFKVRLVRTF